MPRKPRHQEAGAYYHVVSRGNNRQPIFDEELRQLFLGLMRDVAVAFDWRVLAFALMPNHYHFVVKLGTPGLSDGMCVLNNRFARASNNRFDRINHCFGQRFWSSHLDTQYYALNSIRYCLWNPPRANVCPEPGDTRWTSYRGSVGLDPAQPVLAVDDLLGMFHTERSRARRVFSDFVSDGRAGCQAPWDGPTAR